METQAPMVDRVLELKRGLLDAACAFRMDDAESVYRELTDECGVDPDSDDMLPSRVMIGIFKGELSDTLLMLNDLGENRALGLKAVCLRLLGDPLWEGMATEVIETTSDEIVRSSMEALLERPPAY